MTAVRHTTAAVALATQLAAAGWRPSEIPAILSRELGIKPPARSTVHYWLNDGYAEKRRRSGRARKRKHVAAHASGSMRSNHRTPEFRLTRMRALRTAGLSHAAIAKVMTLDFPDAPLTRHQVAGALDDGRVPHTWRGLQA